LSSSLLSLRRFGARRPAELDWRRGGALGSGLPPRSSIWGAAELARTTSCCCAWPDGDLELRPPGSAVARAPCQHGGVPRGLRGNGGPALARRLHLELGRILWRRHGEAGLPSPASLA
jgi:hypothetical protein